jgi:hypothetical protein
MENVKVLTAKTCANDFLSGPSAQVPNMAGPKDGRRHRKVCADGHGLHTKKKQSA